MIGICQLHFLLIFSLLRKYKRVEYSLLTLANQRVRDRVSIRRMLVGVYCSVTTKIRQLCPAGAALVMFLLACYSKNSS